MPLLRNGTAVDGKNEGTILVDLETWRADRDSLLSRNVPLGLCLKPEDAVESIAADIHCFALIALDFPAFTDGRPYSAARLLRERYGYAGELRATGNVLRDQLHFMKRCGFDSFDLAGGVADRDATAAYAAAMAEISVVYQPTGVVSPLGAKQSHG